MVDTDTTNTRPRRPSVTFVSGLTPVPNRHRQHHPAPILRNNISNNNIGNAIMSSSGTGTNTNHRKRPVEFSSDVSIIHSKAEEEDLDESDTDVGSHDFDAEDSFDFSSCCDAGEGDDGMTMAAATVPLLAAVKTNASDRIEDNATMGERKATTSFSSPFISRVGAKIRRLNLNDGNEACGGTSGSSKSNNYSITGSKNVQESKAVVSGPVVLGTDCSGVRNSAVTKLFDSPSRKASSSNIGIGIVQHCKSAQSQSPGGSYWNRSMNTTFVQSSCPPSSVKGRGRQRCLFANDENASLYGRGNEEGYVKGELNSSKKMSVGDDDVSPRDVTNFPSFETPWDSPSKEKMNTIDKGSLKEDQGLEDAPCSPPPSMSKQRCPPRNFSPPAPPPPTPSIKIKSMPHHRRFLDSITPETIQDSFTVLDASGSDAANDAYETVHTSPPRTSLGLRSYGRANSFLQMFSQESLLGQEHYEDVDSMEDDFIHKPNHGEDENEKVAISSPNSNHHRRPTHRRYTPASPEASSPTPSSSSSFSRFLNDFEIVGTLGVGSFGSVYSVRNRTDRRLYAIKAAKREARGSSDRDRMLQEVYALSALSDKGCINSMHIVRYHQAWMEGNRLYIQTELCESTLFQLMRGSGGHKNMDGNNSCVYLDEKQRYKLLREMLLALDLVHKSGMIHLDIKPENIFMKNGQYKLGDFGLVSKIENHDDVEEGDSRYMSMELLSGELDDLTKSDIFSLGATLYEICLGRVQTLPENGPEWQNMRHGILLPMPNTNFDLQMIIREMMSPEWRSRPSAEKLLKKRQLLSDEQRELIVERNKATAANLALDVQMQRLKALSPQNSRKLHRSNTIC